MVSVAGQRKLYSTPLFQSPAFRTVWRSTNDGAEARSGTARRD
jgi:hypothetical protein